MTIVAILGSVMLSAVPLVEGQVLLSDGKPAAKAFLVRQSFGQGAGRSWTQRVDCDAEGRFSFPNDSPLANQIHAYSSDLRESLIEELRSLPAGGKLTIKLKPSCDLDLHFSVPGQPAEGEVLLSVMPTLNLPWLGHMDQGKVRIWVPQGEYKLNIRSDEADFDQATVIAKGGYQKVDIEGKPNPFRKLRGRTAPELEVLDTIGLSGSAKLADFRGKFVLLEFWGWWCKPCVESSIPALIKLFREKPALKEKVVVLAVHENSGGGRTMAQVREHLPMFESRFWGGPMPFPIVLEKPGSLTAKFGIRAYPTAVLIDPEGKVIDRVDASNLAQLVGVP